MYLKKLKIYKNSLMIRVTKEKNKDIKFKNIIYKYKIKNYLITNFSNFVKKFIFKIKKIISI